ncbi:helix-turn-helix domain-containing protein [Streptomyces sp. NPDC085931]|uniref:AraC-like ligand-binding domain-containing protein n=1 Tax=Streptomyces sp. NPDC085931 TaxID=3365740 RepID=UPI0037D4B978
MTVLDTTDLPPGDRTEAWVQTTALAAVTTRFRFPQPERFGARIRAMELGAVQLSTLNYAPLVSYRSAKLIRQADPEVYQLALITSGRQDIEQAGHRTSLGPGEILLYDSSRPFEAQVDVSQDRSSSVLLQFPRHLMPLPDKVVAPACGSALRGSPGLGRVFGQLLTSLADPGAELTGNDRVRLGTTLIDLAAALVAGHVEQTSALPPEVHGTALYQQMTGFIVRQLHDPQLGPAAVAEAHCLSLRSVHRVFRAHATTVSEVIRGERMSRCRRDLADPALATTPVGAIGARWGYPRPSDFTRAFRRATGMTPTAYRVQMQNRF